MDISNEVQPYKETAILLGSPDEDGEARYINANKIISPYNEPEDDNLIIAA